MPTDKHNLKQDSRNSFHAETCSRPHSIVLVFQQIIEKSLNFNDLLRRSLVAWNIFYKKIMQVFQKFELVYL